MGSNVETGKICINNSPDSKYIRDIQVLFCDVQYTWSEVHLHELVTDSRLHGGGLDEHAENLENLHVGRHVTLHTRMPKNKPRFEEY